MWLKDVCEFMKEQKEEMDEFRKEQKKKNDEFRNEQKKEIDEFKTSIQVTVYLFSSFANDHI